MGKKKTDNIKDNSFFVYQRDKLSRQLNIVQHYKLTKIQEDFVNLALSKDSKIIFVSGPAGTSKTYLSVYAALLLMNQKKVSDLSYVRSVVESADSKMGYLPGEVEEKIAPYLNPLIDKLSELLTSDDIRFLKKESRISGIPVGHLRGLNWNAKVIIADEAQNLTFKELVTLMTRIGRFSKLFILGDPEQSDINGKTGFTHMMDLFDDDESRSRGIYIFKFTENDIVRNDFLKFIISRIRANNKSEKLL